jgi:hypothetical protein
MSETARTLIESALRAINAIAVGETPTDDEMADGLQALKFMLRSWSGLNIRIYSIYQDTLAMTGASSYTIGSGGDCDTDWPVDIKGIVVDTDYNLRKIGEAEYRNRNLSTASGPPSFFWYNAAYPLGVIHPFPLSGSSMVIDSLKELTDPSGLTSDVEFHPAYDEAIKWNLAKRLCPEYGKPISADIYDLARQSLKIIESKNMANQINAADLSNQPGRYNIDEG